MALLLLAAVASVSARDLLQSGNTNCPYGCSSAGCVRDTTGGGYRCVACNAGTNGASGWIVIRSTGRCGCPKGQKGSADGCVDCVKGDYCPGGEATSSSTPGTTSCGAGATTLGTRAVSKEQCVNDAGYSWNAAASTAAACEGNTYSTGLKKQPTCTPCPPGFVVLTPGATATSSAACVAPAGFYLKAPGQLAACPMGEWKSGNTLDTSCTKCATGVTTEFAGSTAASDCTILLPGYYYTAGTLPAITTAAACPLNKFCPGGKVADIITAYPGASGYGTTTTDGAVTCPNGRWTKNGASSAEADCLVPPGYELPTAGIAQTIAECATTGRYRENWVYVDKTTGTVACSYCSGIDATVNGFKSEATDSIAQVDAAGTTTTSVVKGSKGSCYINRGEAVYQSAAGFRVEVCSGSNYGVAGKTNGVSAMPCRDCPSGMETKVGNAMSDMFKDGTSGGYYDSRACVTKVGYGYNGRIATKCQVGSWNAGGNNATCTACGYGKTTESWGVDGAGQDAVDDCVVAAGFGTYSGVIQTCPKGSYSTTPVTGACALCADIGGAGAKPGLTTQTEGSTSSDSCNVCAPGYGETNCATACGGGKYSTGGGAIGTACASCPTMTGGGYVFYYNDDNNVYAASPAVSRSGADSVGDCLAQYNQVVDGVGFIAHSGGTPTAAGDGSLTACLGECTTGCMFVTFQYPAAGGSCTKYTPTGSGTEVVGFKAVPSGNIVGAAGTKKSALASGRYTFWKATISAFTNAATATGADRAACMATCDADPECGAVAWDTAAFACKNIKVNVTEATNKRSLSLTVTTQLVDTSAV